MKATGEQGERPVSFRERREDIRPLLIVIHDALIPLLERPIELSRKPAIEIDPPTGQFETGNRGGLGRRIPDRYHSRHRQRCHHHTRDSDHWASYLDEMSSNINRVTSLQPLLAARAHKCVNSLLGNG